MEIARLSLWLRTARTGRKLADLSHRIKIGNSLISDPAVAGDKAFDWEKEFPEVFKKEVLMWWWGIRLMCQPNTFQRKKRIFSKNYKSAYGRINIYPIFMKNL
ncbi:MAG: hypothetical protein IPJ74_25145 [Saprospiraceae bacterium]|nr:hypothetical protein [Saprospiraceae bacterium]